MHEYVDSQQLEIVTPGEILLKEFLEPNNITQAKLAADLGVPASYINAIVNGTQAITVDMATSFSLYFKTSTEFWINAERAFASEKAERAAFLA